MVEKAWTFYRNRFRDEQFIKNLVPCLEKADWSKAADLCECSRSLEPQILLAGLNQISNGKEAVSEAMEAERIRVNLQLSKGLNFLGTLGANAPFIGLFGTVLGIIYAFKDLVLTEGCGGPAVINVASIKEPRRTIIPLASSCSSSKANSCSPIPAWANILRNRQILSFHPEPAE